MEVLFLDFLNMHILSIFFSEGFFIGNKSFIGKPSSWTKLLGQPIVPPFLRFNNVKISMSSKPLSEEELELTEIQLLSLKHALTDSISIGFIACNSEGWGTVDPCNELIRYLAYIRNRLLPICDSSRRYKFFISFWWQDGEVGTKLITSLLQMSEIKRCPNIAIDIAMFRNPPQLPVGEILSWLEKSADEVNVNVQSQHERFLQITSLQIHIQNAREMIDYFKTVFL